MTPGAGQFLAPGAKLNKLGRGPLDDASYLVVSDKKIRFMLHAKYQVLRPCGFRQEDI